MKPIGRPRKTFVCSVEGCGAKHEAKGFCKIHYMRTRNPIHYQEHKAEYALRHRKWIASNREKHNSSSAKWKRNNEERVRSKELDYRKRNPHVYASKSAFRRALKLQATPSWVNKETLKEIYKNRPEGYEVDHIVPLNNPNVCGLHVPWNLQYLTAQENARKHNKF